MARAPLLLLLSLSLLALATMSFAGIVNMPGPVPRPRSPESQTAETIQVSSAAATRGLPPRGATYLIPSRWVPQSFAVNDFNKNWAAVTPPRPPAPSPSLSV